MYTRLGGRSTVVQQPFGSDDNDIRAVSRLCKSGGRAVLLVQPQSYRVMSAWQPRGERVATAWLARGNRVFIEEVTRDLLELLN